MNNQLPKAVIDSADISAITQVILRERESRDLAHWNDMRDCFHPDSHVCLSWFQGNGADFVAGSIDMAKRGVMAKHRLSPVHVRLAGNRAVANLAAIIDIPVLIDGVDLILSAHGRFLYGTEKREECWRISSFDCLYMRDELTPMVPGQSISIDPKALDAFRPSYRMLSYHLTKNGYDVDPDLPGTDREETLHALFNRVYGWAGLKPS